MLMNKQGQKITADSTDYIVGMEISCNKISPYAGLRGHILELRDGDDRETENETIDIVCKLYAPINDDECKKIESRFSELYGRDMTINDISLDYVIMAPSMIEFSDSEDKISNPPATPAESEKITQATAKLEREANSSGGQNVPAIPIYNHLKKLCESRIGFADMVLQEHKTLIKCFTYVYEQVKNTLAKGSQNAWVADDVVYKLAEDYYCLDDAEIERQKAEEKKKREAEAAAAKTEREKQAAAKKADEQAKKNVPEGQITLGMDNDESTDEEDEEKDGDAA